MFYETLFWLYLLFHFQIFIYLTNRVSFHPRWGVLEWLWTFLWSVFFLGAQGIPSFYLTGIWDFTWTGWESLSLAWKLWTEFTLAWALQLLISHSRWILLLKKPVDHCLVRSERVPVPKNLKAPFGFLESIGFENQIYQPRVMEYEVRLKDWPKEFSGLSLVQLSDIHHGKYITLEYLKAVVEAAKKLKPDIFALTGDFISHKKDIPALKGLFKGLKAPLGVYALLGNHDYWADGEAVRRIFEGDGIPVLRNEVVYLKRKGKKLALMGADDHWMGERNKKPILEAKADAKILLAHNPDDFYLGKKAGVHLQISGHCHGGQICFPLIGPLIVPSTHGRKYAGGFIREKDSVLFIHRGIGCYPPLRTFCPPEIVKLVLKPE